MCHMSDEDIKSKFPLHFCVWHNDHSALDELLQQKKYDIEQQDTHGRTPLMLAVVLDYFESARVLLRHSANACSNNPRNYWSVSQEAISSGDPQLLKLVLVNRDSQLVRRQSQIMSDLLNMLRSTPDFYVEMKWEFTSWLPLVSRMCPKDVCRVWKCGASVRIDTNLLGFNGATSWVRGQLTYIFRITKSGAVMDEINHTDRTIYRHQIATTTPSGGGDDDEDERGAAAQMFVREPPEATLAAKITQPIFVTYLDTDKIEFEKSKAGIWGWRSDRKEMINNHNCQVYCASNLQIVTLRRTEHLTEENMRAINQQQTRNRMDSTGSTGAGASADILFPGGQSNLLSNLMQTSAGDSDINTAVKLDTSHEAESYNPDQLKIHHYFSPSSHSRDVGRPKKMTTKVKTFKARLWLCPEYPISLKDQIAPIIDLMSEYNPYFHKLKEFLTKQIPEGFPVKIEIPLYHVLNACVSFGNLNGEDSEVFGVTRMNDDTETKAAAVDATSHPLLGSGLACVIDDSVFDVGNGYQVVVENSPGHYGALYDEEQMVQMAVQRSLVEYGNSDELMNREYSLRKRAIVETKPDAYVQPEEAWLQKAIADSLSLDGAEVPVGMSDATYMKALEDSRIQKDRDDQLRRQEEEELDRVLELSTRDK